MFYSFETQQRERYGFLSRKGRHEEKKVGQNEGASAHALIID